MPPADNSIVVACLADLPGVNELTCQPSNLSTGLLYYALFLPLAEDLTDYEKGPATFVPRAAVGWEFSSDRRRLKFQMRDGLLWSDGVPLTASDVRFTWQAQTHRAIGWKRSGYKRRIRDVEVVDPQTVVFHFSEVYATQLHDAVQGVILPKHAWGELPFESWSESPRWFAEHLVVSGPYELESWARGQSLVLRRNESYYEIPQLPKTERIVLEICSGREAALETMRSGRADVVPFIAPEHQDTVSSEEGLDLVRLRPHTFSFIIWNTSHPFLGDARVRRALTLAIDRQAIVDRFFGDLASVTETPIAPGVWGRHEKLKPNSYDPGAARKLLAEAGWSRADSAGYLTKDGVPFRLELLTNQEEPIRTGILSMVRDHLGHVGVDVHLETTDFLSVLDRLSSHEFDAVLSNMGLSTDLDLSHNFHSRAIEGGLNWGRFSDPRVDALLDEIASEPMPLKNLGRLQEAQELIHELQPMTFLYFSQRAAAVRSSVQGLAPDVVNLFSSLRNWRLEDTGAAESEPNNVGVR